MAGVFARRGVDAWVFRGDDGLDELTTTTTSSLWVVRGGEVTETSVDPGDFGIPTGTVEGLRGDDTVYNAAVIRRLVDGETGPVRDAVRAQRRRRPRGVRLGDRRRPSGAERGHGPGQQSLDSGAAKDILERWISASAAAG